MQQFIILRHLFHFIAHETTPRVSNVVCVGAFNNVRSGNRRRRTSGHDSEVESVYVSASYCSQLCQQRRQSTALRVCQRKFPAELYSCGRLQKLLTASRRLGNAHDLHVGAGAVSDNRQRRQQQYYYYYNYHCCCHCFSVKNVVYIQVLWTQLCDFSCEAHRQAATCAATKIKVLIFAVLDVRLSL